MQIFLSWTVTNGRRVCLKKFLTSSNAFYEMSITRYSISSTKLPVNFSKQKHFECFERSCLLNQKFSIFKSSTFAYLYASSLDGNGIKNLMQGLGYEIILIYNVSPDENWILIEA